MSNPRKKKTPPPTSLQLDPATAYAVDVVKGKVIAGPHVRAACARHLRDLRTAKTRGLYWDVAAVDRVVRFFRDVLRLSEGQFEGIPFVLDASQTFIVGSLFGWKWKATGLRRFRRAYIEQGKGNGKSPFAGGIGLYGMMADGEAGAQIYSAGAKKEQAAILFTDAVKMVSKSPHLAKRITKTGGVHTWNMAHVATGSFFRPISRDAGRSGSGPRPHFALCDEVHEHPDRNTMEMLERGFKFRRQPLLLMITNSGSDRNSVCWEEHSHAVRVAHGDVEDDTTFSYVCALDDGDDPLQDPSCWVKANPLLGKILTHDYLQGVVDQAKAIPGKLNGILRLHFCCWTDAETAWLQRSTYESCVDPSLRLEDFVGRQCWLGLDLGVTNDICGKSYIFEDGFDKEHRPKFVLFARGYTPKDTLAQRALRDKAPYDVWARDGYLIATPGKKVRLDFVAADVVQDTKDFDVEYVAYDRWLIRDFEAEVQAIGGDVPAVEHPQGINQRKDTPLWMPASIESFEKLIVEGRLRIEANPALASAIASATFWTSPAGLRRLDKQRATRRIDLAVSSVMAAGAATAEKPREKEYQILVFGGRSA